MSTSASEAAIEAELKTKGLNAPRPGPAAIDAAIVFIWALEGYLLRERLSAANGTTSEASRPLGDYL